MKNITKKAYKIYEAEGHQSLLNKSARWIYLRIPPAARITFRHEMTKFKHPGVGDPFRLYYLPTEKIKYKMPNELDNSIIRDFNILSGDWDQDTHLISSDEYSVYNMFYSHFEQNIPWEDTKRYQLMKSKLKKEGYISSLSSDEQSIQKYNEYLKYMDWLYKNIKQNGYKLQRNLNKSESFVEQKQYHALREIQIAVGRSGEVFLISGLHRTSIAKLLSIEEVPVRTAIRHKEWQKLRDKIATSDKCVPEPAINHKSHPELQDIL